MIYYQNWVYALLIPKIQKLLVIVGYTKTVGFDIDIYIKRKAVFVLNSKIEKLIVGSDLENFVDFSS